MDQTLLFSHCFRSLQIWKVFVFNSKVFLTLARGGMLSFENHFILTTMLLFAI